MHAYVFPGQGSQFVGMGAEFFRRYPDLTGRADAILGYSIEELCLTDPGKRLNQTRFTQPALFVVNALTYLSRREGGVPPPDFVAGHSVGEYNALFAAEVFGFEAALELVRIRGELMSQAMGGAMAAVIGWDCAAVHDALARNDLSGIDVANYNSTVQIVVSGPAVDMARAEAVFTSLGATFVPLKVSGAFHSRYMQPFVEPFARALALVDFTPPKIPVIANVSALPYGDDDARSYLQRQLSEPVRWMESISYLLDQGVSEFEEVGPGGALRKLIHSIRKHRDSPAARQVSVWGPAADRLGSESFVRDYGVRRAYVAGGMCHGISSRELVIGMARAGYMGYFGSSGLDLAQIEQSVREIGDSLGGKRPFGVNVVCSPDQADADIVLVELLLRNRVRCIEVSGYTVPTRALVRYKLGGLSRSDGGRLVNAHKLLVKLSRPEVAAAFLNPPPERIVRELLERRLISQEQADLAGSVPVADDLCVTADGAWHTEQGSLLVLLPTTLRLRDSICRARRYDTQVRVGAAGGIGTPDAAAAAFFMGADFITTGSVNQCTVEAGTSDAAKDLLQTAGVQDTELAPAADLFEFGAKVRVLKKGVLFPARANRLHELWRAADSWTDVDVASRAKIERDWLGCGFNAVGTAQVVRWYLERGMRLALSGAPDQRNNYQVPCGPALGACNQWMKGTDLEEWRHRRASEIADRIMEGAAKILSRPAA